MPVTVAWEDALKRLSLTGNALGDEGAVALAESGTLRLVHLYLARTGVGLETAEALAKRGRTLKVLTLGGNDELGDEGAKALGKGKALAGLERLERPYRQLNVSQESDGLVPTVQLQFEVDQQRGTHGAAAHLLEGREHRAV